MHLTNYAINKHSKDFVRDDETGSKRRIVTVNRWFEENNYPVDKIWADIEVRTNLWVICFYLRVIICRMSLSRPLLLVTLSSNTITDLVLLVTAKLVLALKYLALMSCWIKS